MSRVVAGWLQRLRTRGPVGPRYSGIGGKLRLLVQELVTRHDVVLVATPESATDPQTLPRSDLELRIVEAWADCEKWRDQLAAEYHPGYANAWREPFEWGEILAVALSRERLVAFGWIHRGTAQGSPCPYACLFEREVRILRVGVPPSLRGQGLNTAFYALALKHLFERGVERVYIDCSRDNLPSLKAQIRAGFRPVGELAVRGPLLGGGFVRWRPLRASVLPPRDSDEH